MMLSVIIGNTEFSLDDGELCVLVGHDGWGSPKVSRVTSQGPLQHGETDEGAFLAPRLGSLILGVPETELDNFYQKRAEILELFSPQYRPILKFDLGYGQRYFDVVFHDELSMPWSPKTWALGKFGVVLKAADPTCYDPQRKSFVFSAPAEINVWEVPSFIPSFLGGDTFEGSQTLEYRGTWIEYPEIQFYGPIEDPVIYNLTTGEKLDFTGTTIDTGEYVIVDTRYGQKTVIDQGGTNLIASLSDDSDLASFHIEPRLPGQSTGPNTFKVTGASTTNATRAIIRYYERYTGI